MARSRQGGLVPVWSTVARGYPAIWIAKKELVASSEHSCCTRESETRQQACTIGKCAAYNLALARKDLALVGRQRKNGFWRPAGRLHRWWQSHDVLPRLDEEDFCSPFADEATLSKRLSEDWKRHFHRVQCSIRLSATVKPRLNNAHQATSVVSRLRAHASFRASPSPQQH